MGQFDKFSPEAKRVLILAQEEAKKANRAYVGTEHILLGILSQPDTLAASILLNFGINLENVRLILKTAERTGEQNENQKNIGGLSDFAKKVIEDSVNLAYSRKHTFVGAEHLLYALMNQKNTAATVILENMKVYPVEILKKIEDLFNQIEQGPQTTTANPLEAFLTGLQGMLVSLQSDDYQDAFQHKGDTPLKKEDIKKRMSKTPALDYFTTDLIAEIHQKKIDPIIGREKEIERVISILNRKNKNNPVLIGEPGVGKTAIADGLAQRIVEEKVPDALINKRILALSMTSLVAGTKYRGEFENRLKKILEEASASENEIILFIDEIHTIIGAGSAEGSLDAANMLKPALSRGKMQIIGATTTNEYRKYIEGDKALERRFQPVVIEEPSLEDAISILKGLKTSYEEFHNIIIDDSAIETAVEMSKRYIPDRFLPDKAIDLIDEAAALRGLRSHSNLGVIKKLQTKLAEIVKQKEEAVSSQNYEKASQLRDEELVLKEKINETRTSKIPPESRTHITEEDIAKVIANVTGVPVTKLVKSDLVRLQNLEGALKKHIVGQNEAINAIAKSIRRSRAGIASEKRPIGSFIFLGPTGVGKTELVKTLAKEVYNNPNALIKIDMSEFMERHNVSRLVGATAGFVGHEEGGQLTEAVRRKPYSVVLFDEIEKAHPEALNLLLQILEDGELTDAKGRKTDFRNTIIVMTSNIGSEKMTASASKIGFNLSSDEAKAAEEDFEEIKTASLGELKENMRPEFLNRIDKIVVFHPLTQKEIKEIVKLQLTELANRVQKNKEIHLKWSDTVVSWLAKTSYNPENGARPVRRAIQENVEDRLAEELLQSKFKEGDVANIIIKNKKIELIKDLIRRGGQNKKC